MLTRRHHRSGGRACWTLSFFMALALSACSPRIVERVVYQHDTTTVHQRDTAYRRDSIYVREWVKGDTVFVDRFRDRFVYRDRWRDSIRVVRDSVAVVETIKEVKVERPLNAWQRFKIGGFWWLLALAAVGWRKQLLWLIKKAAGLFG